MIKGAGRTRDGKVVYVFGLSDENLRLLKDGKPILVPLSEFGSEGHALIIYGPTEEDIQRDLALAGVLPS